jgi:hemerythrin
MAFIKWDDSYSVNVAEIDRQHQKLVVMLNDLHSAMKKGQGRSAVDRIVDGLIDYSIAHFSTEETYFKQYGYPKAAMHTREHADFIARVGSFKRAAAEGGQALPIEVMLFLKDWLLNHIKGSDKDYRGFFNQNGLH